ncbi:MAG: hypothetical protein QOJ65_2429, partial [Fimbriimonadaceae bacterium]|nr:hypothetical protein [Fimbriimonadaceae bacterium]
MTREEFEALLVKATKRLNEDVRQSDKYHKPDAFQQRVFDVLKEVAAGSPLEVNPTFHPHAFPDIRANGFGIEVKSVANDSWLSVGNSVFEGMRDKDVKDIYVMFGKLGGMPAVKWGRYEERITHVRISHAPRFVLEMDRDSSIFGKMGISYDGFCKLTPDKKMGHIREYSRNRLKPGERLWWLEDENSPGMNLEVRLYMKLPPVEKIRLRAEGAILFPQIVGGSREKEKYNDVAFFFLKYRNVFCPQTRDLYTAGSVAGKERGGSYLQRSLKNIEDAMRQAALDLPDELIVEYWGKSVKPEKRIREWLRRADGYAKNWKPSDLLFREEQGK